ncbi:hypothetical protein IEN85_16335 [Pelagicoccus sp. NFK12]|uniref:Polysaccharide chain length determinant N-terminal domain-containing protein n=1 Tax=Pelagicoccus enzymogenes TaxID=2773457 RepID=A0A927FAX9_9BACT|nr:hypothetical protein [Pelagicoccus enzymogenes]MBD5781069.1 hypothetical protein [Pelagicoccus enzymogenes]
MSTPQQQSSGLSITPGDIIYTLFRHLKKIIFFAVLGVIAGAAVFKLMPLPYVSNAKLLVRYVTESQDFVSLDNSNTVSPGGRGDRVMNAELEILRSSDIALTVAEKIGPQTILEDKGQGTPNDLKVAAANSIAKNMSIGVMGRDSSVIQLSYSHNDQEVARKVLQTTIDDYLDKHVETHRSSEAFNTFLLQQTDQLKTRLAQTEAELQRARQKAGVINVTDAKITLSQEIARIRQAVFETDAELAEYQSALESFQQLQAPIAAAKKEAASEEETQQSDAEIAVLAKAIEDFENLRSSMDIMRSREQALLLQFTPENTRVKAIQAKITDAQKKMDDLVAEHPGIRATAITADTKSKTGLNPELEARAQSIRIRALTSRSNTLKSQLAELREEAKRIDAVEAEINELERRRELEETNYKNLVVSLESTRLEEDLRASKTNNISIIQAPSVGQVENKKKLQLTAGVAGGIGIIGLAWALLVDLLLDRSIKRPTEIQRNLGIPLFMSLPDLEDKRFRKTTAKANRLALQQAGKVKQLASGKSKDKYQPKSPTLKAAALARPEEYGDGDKSASREIAPWDDRHALNGHFDALRDKVITYFESKNLTHKPKLIAMTGLGQESGVTTIASGLAGSLSKIGEGNVLLVDMTLGHETAQQFYNGKNILNLDQVLDQATENDAKMENNLYVVAEGTNGTKLPRIMPQRFNKIMPKLRASDFDYIIFDMPPVTPISSTPRLASFMDVVLMVMESEETNRDVANQALELLADSKAHLGGILNKTKSHVPRKLEQDLLSQA